MRKLTILAVLFGAAVLVGAGEEKTEKIRGVLEKTTKPGACAQITDALAEVYYVTKTDEAEKAVEKYVGKNEKVVVTGIVESKEGDPACFFNLKGVEPYAAKMPPPPPAPVITNATASGAVGQAFNYQISATNSPSAYAATGLPGGLAVDAASGAITGSPTTAGKYDVTISATNAGGTGSAPLTLTVAAAPEPKADAKAEPKTDAKTETKAEPPSKK